MSKKIHTIQSSDKKEFDKQVNFYLEYGGELVEGGYEVINNKDGVVYSQVIMFKDCIVEFYDNGNMKRHVPLNHKGQSHGVETSWFDSKQVNHQHKDMESFKNFKNGLKHGEIYVRYYNREDMLEGEYKKGKKHGFFHGHYENGEKQFKVFFKNDIKEGICEQYYRNGTIKSSHTHKRGKIHGNHRSWYENGKRKEQGVYKKGEKIGKWEYWNEDGSLIK